MPQMKVHDPMRKSELSSFFEDRVFAFKLPVNHNKQTKKATAYLEAVHKRELIKNQDLPSCILLAKQ